MSMRTAYAKIIRAAKREFPIGRGQPDTPEGAQEASIIKTFRKRAKEEFNTLPRYKGIAK